MDEEEKERQELAAQVTAARKAAGLSKEAAAKRAGVTTTTWRRVENALRVHDHKRAAIMTAVGLPAFVMPPGFDRDDPFSLPPAIERGYTNTVLFTRAVADEVPTLAQEATRLRLDAAALFAAAGHEVMSRQGGDGDADSTRPGGSAATTMPEAGPAEQPATVDDERVVATKRTAPERP